MEEKQEATNPSLAAEELEENLLSEHKIYVSYPKKGKKTPKKRNNKPAICVIHPQCLCSVREWNKSMFVKLMCKIVKKPPARYLQLLGRCWSLFFALCFKGFANSLKVT